MPRSATDHPEKSRGLLQEFENSLPDFNSLDAEHHIKFVKAIRLLCRCFRISDARLRRDHFFEISPTIARLSELYDEYLAKDALLASAILIVKLHIESHYLDDHDADLVRNLTGLHIYPRIPLDGAPDESAAPADQPEAHSVTARPSNPVEAVRTWAGRTTAWFNHFSWLG
jgi:hypothetical protein